jgi:Protein of unknown function (DUF4231)
MRDVVVERLDDQISWYDNGSKRNQRRFKWLKYVEIVAAALIPILAAFGGVPRWVAAILGGVVVVCESILHLNKHHENWLAYRSTAEALKHEKFLFQAHAGVYAASANPRVLLAERIEALVTDENTKWISHQQEAAAPAQGSEEPSSAELS